MSVVRTSLSDLSLSGFFMQGGNRMAQNTDTADRTNASTAGTFSMRVGNTTYVVGVHFSKTSRDTLEDKVKRLIKDEVKSANF